MLRKLWTLYRNLQQLPTDNTSNLLLHLLHWAMRECVEFFRVDPVGEHRRSRSLTLRDDNPELALWRAGGFALGWRFVAIEGSSSQAAHKREKPRSHVMVIHPLVGDSASSLYGRLLRELDAYI